MKQTRRLHTGVYLESLVLDNCFQWIEVSNYPQASASVPTMGSLKGRGVGEGLVGPAAPISSGAVRLKALKSPHLFPLRHSLLLRRAGQSDGVCRSHDTSISEQKCKHLANI